LDSNDDGAAIKMYLDAKGIIKPNDFPVEFGMTQYYGETEYEVTMERD